MAEMAIASKRTARAWRFRRVPSQLGHTSSDTSSTSTSSAADAARDASEADALAARRRPPARD